MSRLLRSSSPFGYLPDLPAHRGRLLSPAAGVMDSMLLLMFHSFEEIAIAYADRDAHDFSAYMEPWPSGPGDISWVPVQ